MCIRDSCDTLTHTHTHTHTHPHTHTHTHPHTHTHTFRHVPLEGLPSVPGERSCSITQSCRPHRRNITLHLTHVHLRELLARLTLPEPFIVTGLLCITQGTRKLITISLSILHCPVRCSPDERTRDSPLPGIQHRGGSGSVLPGFLSQLRVDDCV